jgi:hypothetical protein
LKDSEGTELPDPVSLKPDDKNLLNKITGIYQRLTGSSKGVESEVIETPVPKKESTTKSATYKVGGKSYTKSDLNKMGYTDAQIEQAIKLGTIKQ